MRRLFGEDERPSFYGSVRKLIGHFIGGSILFASIAALAWLLSWAVDHLNAIHPFSQSVLTLLHGLEVALLYLDFGLSGMVLLIGAYRFIRENTGERT